MALVLKYDSPIPTPQRRKDLKLGLLHVGARPRKQADFIFVQSIIRGAMLVDCFDEVPRNQCFVVDTVDTDMFLRLRDLYR